MSIIYNGEYPGHYVCHIYLGIPRSVGLSYTLTCEGLRRYARAYVIIHQSLSLHVQVIGPKSLLSVLTCLNFDKIE